MSAPLNKKTVVPAFRIIRGVMRDFDVKESNGNIASDGNENRPDTSFIDEKINKTKNKLQGSLEIKVPKEIRYAMIGALCIFLIVLAVLLLTTLLRFIKARHMGSLSKSQCGKEYMERETQRYYIYQEYDKVKYQTAAINIILLTCMFVVFAYIAINSFFIFSAIWKVYENIDVAEGETHSRLNRILFSRKTYIIFVLFFVASVISTYIPAWTTWIYNKQLKHNTGMTNRQYNSVLKPFLTFVFVFSFSLFIMFFLIGIKTNMFSMAIVLLLLYGAVTLFTMYFTRFHNQVIVPYAKYSGDLNLYLTNFVNGSTEISGKVKSYITENIKRSDPNINVPDVTKYKDQYYSYAIHNENGSESFDKGGASSSVSVATFKSTFAELFNAVPITTTDESQFNTQINKIKYPSGNTDYTKYANENYNVLMRKYLVDLAYTDEQKSKGVIMGSDIVYVCTKYSIDTTSIQNIFKTNNEYKLYDDEYQQLRAGDFDRPSVYRILNEMHQRGTITNQQTVDDIMHILLLKMTIYNTASINLKTAIDKIESIKDTLSYENPVSLYAVMEKLQTMIEEYMNKNLSDSKFEQKMSNLRSIDGSIKTHMDKMINFMFALTAIVFVISLFTIFHKIYHNEDYKDQFVLWLPLSLILMIICVTIYSWVTGNMKV